MTNERIAEIIARTKKQVISLGEDGNPYFECFVTDIWELLDYIEHLEQRIAKLQAVRDAAKENKYWEDQYWERGKLDITEWNSMHFAYQNLDEALEAAEDKA